MSILPIVLTLLITVVIYSIFAGVTGVDVLSVRRGGTPVTQTDVSIIDEVMVYQLETGQFILVLPESWGEQDNMFGATTLLLIILCAFVFIINRILVKFVFQHVIGSVNTLASGVREISEGNLEYRIEHKTGNEFDAVCSDFNEMATRLHDMVEQRQADEKSRRELIAGISHDLRTPLTSIKAYVEGIKKGVASTPEMQSKYLDTIQEKTDDLEYIINQLFLFSKIDIGEFPFNLEIVDIENELNKIVGGLADEYLERGLAVSLQRNVQGAFVSIDTMQFRNVIQNILNNSVKYGNKENGTSVISCRKYNGCISITITDNGSGVSGAMIPKLFDVFYRGDASRTSPSKGSGLGLAICSKIIERLDGTLKAENAPDGGLSIIITLPRQKGGSA
jgi:signal transduction histidine kinase